MLAVLAIYWGHWAEDLAALFMAGHLWATGNAELIYAAPDTFMGGTPPQWLPEVARIGMSGRTFYPYVYPPLWAVLLAPPAELLGPEGFNTAFTLIQVPLLAGSIWLAGSIARPASMSFRLWMLIGLGVLSLTVVGRSALYFMQPSIVTAFLTLLAFERLGKGAPLAAGIALALATALKLSPAIFVVAFLIDRQGRALASFAATLAILTAASLWLGGAAAHEDFLTALHRAGSFLYITPGNVSFGAALLSLGGLTGLWPGIDPHSVHLVIWGQPAMIGMVQKLGLVITIAALWPARGPHARPFVLIALGLAMPLFGPIGWLHYLITSALLAPVILGTFRRRDALILLAGAALAFSIPVYDFFGMLPWPTVTYQWLTAGTCTGLLAAAVICARRMSRTAG